MLTCAIPISLHYQLPLISNPPLAGAYSRWTGTVDTQPKWHVIVDYKFFHDRYFYTQVQYTLWSEGNLVHELTVLVLFMTVLRHVSGITSKCTKELCIS